MQYIRLRNWTTPSESEDAIYRVSDSAARRIKRLVQKNSHLAARKLLDRLGRKVEPTADIQVAVY